MTIKKSCFVIMPYGVKSYAPNKKLDFDGIYDDLIKPTLETRKPDPPVCPGYEVVCQRCDDFEKPGWIHRTMIQQIFRSDLAVVDLTALNANVFYELGVRHALVPAGTILIRIKGTKLPFNIAGFNTISYPDPKGKGTEAELAEFRERLRQHVRHALTKGGVDSLVHDAVDVEIRTKSPPIRESRVYEAKIKNTSSKAVGLITGDIVNVRTVDAWVNSENTNMKMDRHEGGSISSVIRYFGAKKDRSDHVEKDIIADELAEAMAGFRSVNPGSVIATSSGMLKRRNNVKKIFHVASVIGQVRVGFKPVPDLGACVERVLEMASSQEYAEAGIRSILFPLMGTGTARGTLEHRARELIDAAVCFFANNPSCSLENVFFLNWTKDEFDVCSRILEQDERLNKTTSSRVVRTAGAPAKSRPTSTTK